MRQTNEKEVMDAAEKQFALLSEHAAFVKPNGLLVYCTCSLSRFENQEVARRFLENHSEFEHSRIASKFGLTENGRGVTVFPRDFNGDGLYVASFKRSSSPGAFQRTNK
jgi:16S rRNA (cytosine967-C5)-methyltransferase